LGNRLDALAYPGALALGLPIGSGMIEIGTGMSSKPGSKRPATLGCPDTPTQSSSCAFSTPTTDASRSGTDPHQE
jgi:hypothetical protein